MHAPPGRRIGPTSSLLAIVLVAVPGPAWGFHEGGVGYCEGCHAMHGATPSAYLLSTGDASSACLNCHAGATPLAHSVLTTGVSPGLAPQNFTPGGDFGWLQKSFTWIGGTSPGERHGHNVVAVDFALGPDGTNLVAPNGTYPSARFSCVSCHDPHGTYRQLAGGTIARTEAPTVGSGSYSGARFLRPGPRAAIGVYRLLGGIGYATRSSGNVPQFIANPPVALAPPVYNLSERTFPVRVAYGTGMNEWCGNCHADIHVDAAEVFRHPPSTDWRFRPAEADHYNAYIKSGDLSGVRGTSYWSLVPYEEGTADRVALEPLARADGSALGGPSSTEVERISCLSCHRAHASGWDRAGRWNLRDRQNAMIVVSGEWPGVNAISIEARDPSRAQGRTVAETRAAMYDREPTVFATNQPGLCEKCHAP